MLTNPNSAEPRASVGDTAVTRNDSLSRAEAQAFEHLGRSVDFRALARQKRLLYDLLNASGIREPDSRRPSSSPLQELWRLVDLCEDLLDAAELEGLWRGDEDDAKPPPLRSAAGSCKP